MTFIKYKCDSSMNIEILFLWYTSIKIKWINKSEENMYLRKSICHFSTPTQKCQDLQVVESDI